MNQQQGTNQNDFQQGEYKKNNIYQIDSNHKMQQQQQQGGAEAMMFNIIKKDYIIEWYKDILRNPIALS